MWLACISRAENRAVTMNPPQILSPVGQHNARYHRRQIGQGHDFPYMAGSYDDEEIAAERPDDGAKRRERLPEIERPQQDVEAEKIGKDIPHILGKPQMIELTHTVEHIGTLVRRRHLIGWHTAEERVGPASGLACALIIFG